MKKAIIPAVLYTSRRNNVTRNCLATMTGGASSDKPPPEFPAAPPPDKPSESSEAPQAPSLPDYDRTPPETLPSDAQPPQETVPRHDPYAPGPELPNPRQQQTRVVQPHGAKVQTPIPPEPDHVISS